jgi:hypothetical protein
MSPKEIVTEAVRRALKIARIDGIEIGKIVAHPSDPYSYELTEKAEGLATLVVEAESSPTGERIEKKFPLDEIFDVNVVKDQAMLIRDEEIAEDFPGAVVVRV